MRGKVIKLTAAVIIAGILAVVFFGTRNRDREFRDFIDDFSQATDEMAVKLESDPVLGVDEARRILDERQARLREKFVRLKSDDDASTSEEMRRVFKQSIENNSAKLTRVFIKNIGQVKENESLKEKYQKLLADYGAIVR